MCREWAVEGGGVGRGDVWYREAVYISVCVTDGRAEIRHTSCDAEKRGCRGADMAARVPAAPGCAVIAEAFCDAGPLWKGGERFGSGER